MLWLSRSPRKIPKRPPHSFCMWAVVRDDPRHPDSPSHYLICLDHGVPCVFGNKGDAVQKLLNAEVSAIRDYNMRVVEVTAEFYEV